MDEMKQKETVIEAPKMLDDDCYIQTFADCNHRSDPNFCGVQAKITAC